MAGTTQTTLIAVLSAMAGAIVTILLASLFTVPDPTLVAAEQHYQNLSASDAQRVQATFDHLHQPGSSDERDRIQAIHATVSADPKLEARLEQLYAWWSTRSDAQRFELRELQQTDADSWVAETQQQYLKTSQSDQIELTFRGRRGPGRSTLYVSRDQVAKFLEVAVPDDTLSVKDASLIAGLDPSDRPLARVVMFPSVFSRLRERDTRERVGNAFRTHLLSGNQTGHRDVHPEVAGSLLRAIKESLSTEFFERHSVSNEMIEQQFTELNASERVKHMISDSAEAADALRALHSSDDPDSPVSQLAARLAEFDSRMSMIRRQRSPSGRGPRRGDPTDGERRGRRGEQDFRGPDGLFRGGRDRNGGPPERDERGRPELFPDGPRPGRGPGGPGRRDPRPE